MLENFLKYNRYTFDWENVTAPNSKDSDGLKDFLRLRGLNWKGDLQFRKDGRFLSPFGDEIVFAKNQKKVSSIFIELVEIFKKATLSIDGNISYEFVVKEENDKLKIYPYEEVSLESAMAVYRNLRENYEYRLRYDEAGKFFIKEMELKRKYRNVRSKNSNGFEVKENCRFRRNLSLTGIYYHFSNYGESIVKPTIIGAITNNIFTQLCILDRADRNSAREQARHDLNKLAEGLNAFPDKINVAYIAEVIYRT
jgi:hypothetical protein